MSHHHRQRFSSASTLRVGSTRSTISLRGGGGTAVSQYHHNKKAPTLGDLLAARPTGLLEQEAWAILCQSVQALQDLFLSDGTSGTNCIPLITPATLTLSSKGRVKLCPNPLCFGSGPPAHVSGYLAPEYRASKNYSDTEFEKMWIFGLGETLKRATLTSQMATSRISNDLCQILTDMTKAQPGSRATLMNLLDVISEYCKKRQQNRPFSHIVMDLYQETLVSLEETIDASWGPPAMPEIVPRTKTRSESTSESTGFSTLPRRWMGLSKSHNILPKITREASTSMEDLNCVRALNTPGKACRPKSICVPTDGNFYGQNEALDNDRIYSEPDNNNFYPDVIISDHPVHRFNPVNQETDFMTNNKRNSCDIMTNREHEKQEEEKPKGKGPNYRRLKVRRNPIQRSASRLYRTGIDQPVPHQTGLKDCIGPEFVVRAALPVKHLSLGDCKGTKKTVTVILLDGQKIDVACSANSTTAGQLFEMVIQEEHIEENFMLGLSTLIAGDFVFLPSDTRICKVMEPNSNPVINLTLFLRVRFFLPSLRGIRGSQARHLLYLQLRRSILEHQLPCSFSQIIELNGLALQAEFGNYSERLNIAVKIVQKLYYAMFQNYAVFVLGIFYIASKENVCWDSVSDDLSVRNYMHKKEHGTRDYFLLEHYVPETMISVIDDQKRLRQELIKAHISKKGLEREKTEQDFISFTQSLPHYGGHFYTATWILKDSKETKDIWLYISAQGINLYERGKTTSNFGPQLYENFEWRSIQTLCYSKHYLCILPHSSINHRSKLKKYKLKMDHKKSYFAFRLASLHHQFFLRLRTEFTSLQSLSQQFGVPLKDIKNETNSLYKLDALTRPLYSEIEYGQYGGSINAETEFKIEFRTSSRSSKGRKIEQLRSKSVEDLVNLNQNKGLDNNDEEYQNKENENPKIRYNGALILDSSCLAGLPNGGGEKRRGVKMGTRAISAVHTRRVSRSMEAVNCQENDYLEQMSLQSVSLHCSSNSISKPSSTAGDCVGVTEEAYILDLTFQSYPNQLLPNFQESLNETLIEKLNNMSFIEERYLSSVEIEKDSKHSLGLKITEGSDGNVYVQSVIPDGPAHLCGKITAGDQIVAVNNQCLLGVNYSAALEILKTTGKKVEFVLSRMSKNLSSQLKSKRNLSNISEDDLKNISLTSDRIRELHDLTNNGIERKATENLSTHKYNNAVSNLEHLQSINDNLNHNKPQKFYFEQNETHILARTIADSPVEKHLTESCYDISNNGKYKLFENSDLINFINIPIDSEISSKNNDRAIIVDMIPKKTVGLFKYEPFAFESDFANDLVNLVRKPPEEDDSVKNVDIANLNRNYLTDDKILLPNKIETYTKNAVALPRTMGLSRKWKGPVKYPVTPVKKSGIEEKIEKRKEEIGSTSDEDQVFI